MSSETVPILPSNQGALLAKSSLSSEISIKSLEYGVQIFTIFPLYLKQRGMLQACLTVLIYVGMH